MRGHGLAPLHLAARPNPGDAAVPGRDQQIPIVQGPGLLGIATHAEGPRAFPIGSVGHDPAVFRKKRDCAIGMHHDPGLSVGPIRDIPGRRESRTGPYGATVGVEEQDRAVVVCGVHDARSGQPNLAVELGFQREGARHVPPGADLQDLVRIAEQCDGHFAAGGDGAADRGVGGADGLRPNDVASRVDPEQLLLLFPHGNDHDRARTGCSKGLNRVARKGPQDCITHSACLELDD